MGLTSGFRRFLLRLLGVPDGTIISRQEIKELKPAEQGKITTPNQTDEIHSLWDYIPLKENTQAFHLAQVTSFDEWLDMEEIRRRILELFGIEYKNERSLYPHLKTLTDLSLFETTDVGGKRKWRKKDLLLTLNKAKEKKKAKEEAKATAQSQEKTSE